MATEIEIFQLPEPLLEFGGVGEFTDPKVGLKEAGPFDLRFGTARKDKIKIGFIGNPSMIEKGQNWLRLCKGPIESRMANTAQYPHFPGFQSLFKAELTFNERWNYAIADLLLNSALTNGKRPEIFGAVLELFEGGLKYLATLDVAKPDVIFCCLSAEVIEKCWSIENEKVKREHRKKIKSLANQLTLFELSEWTREPIEEQQEDIMNRDFRRALKAKAMRHGIPIQIGTDSLFLDQPKNQDTAIRAWNSNVALYYKAGGIPWRLRREDLETCYVGVSFYHLFTTHGAHLVRSCIAQAFSSDGEGFAIRGVNIEWEEGQGRNVHLTETQAMELGEKILREYHYRTGTTPLRIVMHKSSHFNEDEKKGLYSVLNNVPFVELINLAPTDFRLLRFGPYPPTRGTLCVVNKSNSFLFTTGFMKKLGTYPGPHIPVPMQIKTDEEREIDVNRVAQDVIGLARMNWNTASITGGHPVTLLFSRRVGGIMAEFGESDPPSSFRFYL